MRQDLLPHLYRYMEAHVRLNANCDIGNQGPDMIQAMFSLLKKPSVGFDEWAPLMGIDLTDPLEVNEAAIKAMVGDGVAKLQEQPDNG